MVEVDNFLDLLASEFEALLKEINQLREEEQRNLAQIHELEAADKQLRDTLVSVQHITEEMKSNARKEGELIIEEARGNARKIVESAQAQAIKVEAEIHHLKRQRAQFKASLKSTIELHRNLLETDPEDPNRDREKENEEGH